jgi:hypothetical protein
MGFAISGYCGGGGYGEESGNGNPYSVLVSSYDGLDENGDCLFIIAFVEIKCVRVVSANYLLGG